MDDSRPLHHLHRLRETAYAKHRDVVRLRRTLGERGYLVGYKVDQVLATESATRAQYFHQASIGQIVFDRILGLGDSIGVQEK